MTSVLLNRRFILIAYLSVVLLALAILYIPHKELVIYENGNVDGNGFKALVTCRPDEMFTYYPYLIIKTPKGSEVSRSQLNGLGYDASQACRNSFPVVRLDITPDKRSVRLSFNGRNAFGDTDTLDVAVRYFSPR